MSTFTVVDDGVLCTAIESCKHTLVYVAPGISRPIVEQIERQINFSPDLAVTLILDIDPEVYRLGYGTLEGLQAVQALVKLEHLELRQQSGLRIGLLICDEKTLVYSPTPLLIEAGSHSSEKPNAIWVGRNQDLPAALSDACELGGGDIGQQAIPPDKVEESLESLRRDPPKKFDIARIERVFHSKIQFVELEVTKYRLSSKKINIPNDLLIGEDKVLNDKLKNSFKLLDGGAAPVVQIPVFDEESGAPRIENGKDVVEVWDEGALEKARKKLYENFLINVPRFGWVLTLQSKRKFERRLKQFTQQVEAYKTAVLKSVDKALDDAVEELVEVLHPRITGNLPDRMLKFMTDSPSEHDVKAALRGELRHTLGTVCSVFDPEVRCVFKGVTYESIKGGEFIDALAAAMRKKGAVTQAELLFSEYDAAAARN